MSESPAPRPAEAGHDFPYLPHLFTRIRESLESRAQLGLVAVIVLQRAEAESSAAWSAYETMVREASEFLSDYRSRHMRAGDQWLGPSVSGNAFVLLIDAPRDGRSLGKVEILRVQERIRRALRDHLTPRLSKEITDRFGFYVGGAMMRHEPSVPLERIVYRSQEEAFADALRDKEREDRRSVRQLRRVLKTERVRSVYQPVVDLVERSIIGYEALTRVPRGHFDNVELMFKAAQKNDVLWTLERLCRRKAVEGLPRLDSGQLLFLNIETQSIQDPELRDLPFQSLLESAGLKPEQIVLEMTEHSAVRDFIALRRTLEQFRERGYRFAMDDVGSGYAGLHAIAEIAPDYIKVDMSLVRNLHSSPIKRELVATIRHFADRTGISLVAEGVETPDELRSLREVGVRRAQGFLFARPGSPPTDPDWSVLS